MAIAEELTSTAATSSSRDGVPDFFKTEPTLDLEQGDLIPRTAPIISETLRSFHQYHVEKTANEMFAVLTQSCDLVRHNGHCKAKYISFAPVRPLRRILDREFRDFLVRTPGELYVLGSSETQARYEDLLAKLINNNDSRHFFIPERPDLQISEDMCVMLPLSLSIRVEHYDACLQGRVAQLTDLFQAKLGWLLGQQFSRVGTPDWTESALDKKVRSISDRTLSWLPDHEFQQVRSALKKFEIDSPDVHMDEQTFQQIRKSIQSKRDLAISAVLDALVKLKLIPEPPNKTCFQIRKELRNDSTFAKFFPNS